MDNSRRKKNKTKKRNFKLSEAQAAKKKRQFVESDSSDDFQAPTSHHQFPEPREV